MPLLPWYRPWVAVAAESGRRKGELAKLQPPEVDFHTGFFRVLRSKTGESRMVPMSRRVREVLSAMVHRIDGPCVFTGPDGDAVYVSGAGLPQGGSPGVR
ncbi:MAG: tyrosine-type recombinase/integrase [Nitrospinota bacterium]